MPETKTYTGGCHCGAVRFRVETDLSSVITCNCSMCFKTGAWLMFVPAEKFVLETSEEALQDYQFNKKVIHHLFCKTCGLHPFGRGIGPGDVPMYAVDIRCLDEISLEGIVPTPYDGRSA